jgi:tetratricopeptide (TPR) repeat protein
MNNLRDIETIEKYLVGSLTEREMEDVEIRTLVDQAFHDEFQTVRLLIRGIEESARHSSLTNKIQQLETSSRPSAAGRMVNIAPRHNWLRYGLVAAMALLFFSVPFLTQQRSTPEQLFARYFEVSPNLGLQASRSDAYTLPASQAYRAYDSGDYAGAARLFESMIEESDHRMTDLYHLGNCYLALGAWDQGIAALEEVATSGIGLSENARWYLSLAYLRTGETGKAKKLLQEVAAPMERARKAHNIFKQLE